MLLINYINQWYEAFTVPGKIGEAFEADHNEQKRVYLSEDFQVQNFSNFQYFQISSFNHTRLNKSKKLIRHLG
ncbi:hypothetical protein ACJVC5_10850 [Peredibacter sp. HCB2-198]|uniref:hypothetical protein n=1 Tax=Peredibacter sp. HCB2-198 TaxID=3383025 RepID=UPI0038B425DE